MSAVIPAGYKTKVLWIEEVTEGTAPSGGTPPPTYTAEYLMIEERISRDLITQPTISSRTWSFIDMGMKQYVLNLTLFPVNNTLLDYAVANIDKTLTIWVQYPDLARHHVYTACKPNTLRLTGAANTLTQATMEIWAAKLNTTAPTANEGSLPTALPYHGRDSYVKLGATTLNEVRAWNIEVRNNLERIPALGSDEIRFARMRNLEVTGELTATFETTSRLNELLNNTEFTLEIGLGKDSGSTVRKATITGCKWREHPIPSRKTDLIMLRLPFTGRNITLA